jgi:hypothetical protein
MRLAQAARKLSITTEDIVDFLEIRGVSIEKDSNTKLDEEAVEILYKYFEIEEESAIKVEEDYKKNKSDVQEEELEGESEEGNEESEVKQESEKSVEEEKVIPLNEAQPDVEDRAISIKKSFKTVDELLEGDDENPNDDFVIKAPKVELRGLNVVGKIDLPEPKPKSKPDQKAEIDQKRGQIVSKKRPQRSPKNKQKRELSPSEIRKREVDREARKQERIKKEKKRKREEFYKEKILKPKQIEQQNKPKKRKSLVEEASNQKKPTPKTVFGKFWRWLNT